MTVRELRAKLALLDDDLPVEIEGWDCIGLAKDVETYTTYEEVLTVLITRDMDA